MTLRQVVSDALDAVGYDAPSRRLRVRFRRGGLYEYEDVEPGLYAELLTPHPWHRVGQRVRSHRFTRLD